MERTTALRAQGRCGFDGIVGFGTSQGQQHRMLREDDGAVGLGMTRVDGVVGLATTPSAQCHGLEEGDVVAASAMAL
jgi:hypothetical protein